MSDDEMHAPPAEKPSVMPPADKPSLASPADKPSPELPAKTSSPEPQTKKPSLKQRLSDLFADYGRVAIVTYFTISGLAIIGFSIAAWQTLDPSSNVGVFGVIVAGWGAAKVTMPIRIVITLVLTPIIATIVRRRHRATAVEQPDEPEVPDAEPQ